MGLLWKLLAPEPLKSAQRTTRKAAHPVRTATWRLAPKPVKQVLRMALNAALPLEAESAAESAAVNPARDGRRRAKTSTYRSARAQAAADTYRKVRITYLARDDESGAEAALRLFRERGVTIVSVKEDWLSAAPEIQDVLLPFFGLDGAARVSAAQRAHEGWSGETQG